MLDRIGPGGAGVDLRGDGVEFWWGRTVGNGELGVEWAGGLGTGGGCMLAGSGGSAGCSVLYTPTAVGSGTHTITARYGGGAMHAASTGTTAVTVSAAMKRATSIAVACWPGTVAPGGSTSRMVTVTDVAGGAPGLPGGAVDFVQTGGSGVTGGGNCVLSEEMAEWRVARRRPPSVRRRSGPIRSRRSMAATGHTPAGPA